MSGHSKWSTIKRKKGAADARRGKIFSKFAKEITIAAKLGGPNPEANSRLRTVLMAARAQNMPKDNIERAIKKGTGELPGTSYEDVRYEGYGPGGVAIIIDVLTDNKNRTVADIRHRLSKHGGTMAESGAVLWNFEQKGAVTVLKSDRTEEELFEMAIEAGAEDVESTGDIFEVTTEPHQVHAVAQTLESMGLQVDNVQLTLVPKTTLRITGKAASAVLRLMEALEDHDDVQNVFSNFDIPEAELIALAEA